MNIENVREATKKLSEAMSLFGSGPLDFYLRELIAAHDLLIKRFAPFKSGDRVRLITPPDFDKTTGLQHCKHFLVHGAEGTVKSVECGEGGFRFGVVFDNESWIDTQGFVGKKGAYVAIDDKHAFSFSPNDIELL